jgi:hypothetical protein
MQAYAKTLKYDGVVVIPIKRSFVDNRNMFIHSKHVEFREINPELFVIGHYGALGHPTSFHHEEIREIRKKVYLELKEFWKIVCDDSDSNLELLLDRFSIRKKGTKVSAESWHRDVCSVRIKDDFIYGGWINLDDKDSEPQYFSCVPKTHLESSNDEGFAKIGKDDSKKYKDLRVRYKIPAGHIIIFSQNIVHEVISKAYKTDTYKLYIGWRVTKQTESLFKENITEAIPNQGLIRIPSGQIPEMFTKNHRRFFPDKVKEFSDLLIPEYLDKVGYVKQRLPSLKETGLELCSRYSEEDIEILVPTKP